MGMRDETLSEPFAVQEFYVDGFADHTIINGNMSCVGYRILPASHFNGEPQKIVVVRLVWPVCSTDQAIADARRAQATPFFVSDEPAQKRH